MREGKEMRGREGVRGSGFWPADRGPFILHARADRELALWDTAHKSETVAPCCHTPTLPDKHLHTVHKHP